MADKLQKISGGACGKRAGNGACITRTAIGGDRLSNHEVSEPKVTDEPSVTSTEPSSVMRDA